MAEDKIKRKVEHYQRKLERSAKKEDQRKILHCIRKLSGLPMPISVLAETRIGYTVNAVRKMVGGEVNGPGRALISQWWDLIAANQVDRCEDARNTTEESGSVESADASSSSSEEATLKRKREESREEELIPSKQLRNDVPSSTEKLTPASRLNSAAIVNSAKTASKGKGKAKKIVAPLMKKALAMRRLCRY